MTKYFTDAIVVYHHVNAFEEDGQVIFDVIAYEDNSLYDMFYLAVLKQQSQSSRSFNRPVYKRFVLPTQSDKVWLNTNEEGYLEHVLYM